MKRRQPRNAENANETKGGTGDDDNNNTGNNNTNSEEKSGNAFLGSFAGPPIGSVPEGRIDWNQDFGMYTSTSVAAGGFVGTSLP